MKNSKLFALWSNALFVALSAQGQGSFQNLNFEKANPVYVGNPIFSEITAASAFPDWTVAIGGVQQSTVYYNTESTGATAVSLIGVGAEPIESPIDGNFSVLLEGGGTATAASISQIGLIPSGTQSLLFEAEAVIPPGPLEVLIGTQNVPLTALNTGPDYTTYGADIAAWAGNTEQLTFSTPAVNTGLNGWEIDDISFSQTVVSPESGTLSLTALGGLLFAARKWFAPCK